jgi:hypothetical protein
MIIVVACNGKWGGNKLQINPTYSTYPTQAILHKALRLMTGVGYVGLGGGFVVAA